jgi:predicted nucleic acid-binding protein
MPLVSSALLARRALELAQTYNRSTYDCLYLALALERDCELITGGARFFNAIGPAFPLVKLVGGLKS